MVCDLVWHLPTLFPQIVESIKTLVKLVKLTTVVRTINHSPKIFRIVLSIFNDL